jgi:hypothetical protein
MRVFRAKIFGVVAVVLGFALVSAGCSFVRQFVRQEAAKKPAPRFVKMHAKLDYSEHKPYAQPGENGISGQAFLKQQGEAVVTCAGNRVLLLPATSYFREMIGHMVAGSEPEPPEKTYPSLKNMIRRTQCDARGNFSFSEVPDGAWFVLTQVNARYGGVLITEMTLSNHLMREIVLTNKHLVGR